MKRIIILVTTIFYCFFWLSFDEKIESKVAECHVLTLKEDKLTSILDSLIQFEQRCQFYTDSLMFSINVRNKGEIIELQISAHKCMQSLFDFYKPVYGCFYKQNHLFIVYDSRSSTFFNKTDKMISFKHEGKAKKDKTGDPIILENLNDDSNSYWNFWYVDSVFVSKGASSSCL